MKNLCKLFYSLRVGAAFCSFVSTISAFCDAEFIGYLLLSQSGFNASSFQFLVKFHVLTSYGYSI